jgi:hypothetical protein
MNSHRHPHTLNASTNLLGICFIIIGWLKFTGKNPLSYADEIAWFAAVLLLTSTIFSYLCIRHEDSSAWQAWVADATFIAGVLALSSSVLVAAIYL